MTKLLNTAKKSGNNIMVLKLLIELAEITGPVTGARENRLHKFKKKEPIDYKKEGHKWVKNTEL